MDKQAIQNLRRRARALEGTDIVIDDQYGEEHLVDASGTVRRWDEVADHWTVTGVLPSSERFVRAIYRAYQVAPLDTATVEDGRAVDRLRDLLRALPGSGNRRTQAHALYRILGDRTGQAAIEAALDD